MKAINIKNGKGPATSLFHDEIDTPSPKDTEALVKVKAFGLNRMDLLQREGKYPLPPQAPSTLGVEFSGTVEKLGDEADGDFKVGDEVFGLAYGGAYAEYIAVSTKMLIHKPSHLSWEQAAGVPEVWITAIQALNVVGDFQQGKSVLWHAGASSVSIAGIQLSVSEGASAVYATARADEKCDLAKDLGCKAAFNTKSVDFAEEVLKATDNKGVDLIIDFIGKDTFDQNLKALAKDGCLVMLGMMSGSQLDAGVDIGPLVFKRLRVQGSTLRSREVDYQKKLRDEFVKNALPKFENGSFKVLIEKVMPWGKIVEAHQLMESNQTKGKIICTIE